MNSLFAAFHCLYRHIYSDLLLFFAGILISVRWRDHHMFRCSVGAATCLAEDGVLLWRCLWAVSFAAAAWQHTSWTPPASSCRSITVARAWAFERLDKRLAVRRMNDNAVVTDNGV